MLSNQQNSLFVYILLENLPMHNHIPMKQFHRVNHHRLGGRQNLPDTSLCLRYPHTSWNWLYSDPRMPICSLNVYKNIVNSFRPRSWLIIFFVLSFDILLLLSYLCLFWWVHWQIGEYQMKVHPQIGYPNRKRSQNQ